MSGETYVQMVNPDASGAAEALKGKRQLAVMCSPLVILIA